eukprot:1433120-Pleurochrysis_carterae.AAC.1
MSSRQSHRQNSFSSSECCEIQGRILKTRSISGCRDDDACTKDAVHICAIQPARQLHSRRAHCRDPEMLNQRLNGVVIVSARDEDNFMKPQSARRVPRG